MDDETSQDGQQCESNLPTAQQRRVAEELRMLSKLLAAGGGWEQQYVDACTIAAVELSGKR